jgi:GlpG protein
MVERPAKAALWLSSWVTSLLVVACLLVAWLSHLGDDTEAVLGWFFSENGYATGAASFAEIRAGQVWRLVSPMFLHFGLIHLVFNLLWLHDLGRALEYRIGRQRYIFLVLISSVVANVAQATLSHPIFGGMSGVVYGLAGYAIMQQQLRPEQSRLLSQDSIRWLLLWLVICFTGVLGPVANAAHVGGLVAGAVLGWAWTGRSTVA